MDLNNQKSFLESIVKADPEFYFSYPFTPVSQPNYSLSFLTHAIAHLEAIPIQKSFRFQFPELQVGENPGYLPLWSKIPRVPLPLALFGEKQTTEFAC